MVCYHQNPIRRTLGANNLPLFDDDKPWLSRKEKKSPPQTNHGSIKRFLIGSNVKHENEQWIKIPYHIYMETSHVQ